jgi:hypothetical protein
MGLQIKRVYEGTSPPNEHLDELGAAQAEERDMRFARHGAGQQGLAGAGRTEQEHALGNAAADPAVSVDLLLRALFALGARRRDIAATIQKGQSAAT